VVERRAATVAEVKKLLEAGFIRECQYPEWVSNVVLVKKKSLTELGGCALISLT